MKLTSEQINALKPEASDTLEEIRQKIFACMEHMTREDVSLALQGHDYDKGENA